MLMLQLTASTNCCPFPPLLPPLLQPHKPIPVPALHAAAPCRPAAARRTWTGAPWLDAVSSNPLDMNLLPSMKRKKGSKKGAGAPDLTRCVRAPASRPANRRVLLMRWPGRCIMLWAEEGAAAATAAAVRRWLAVGRSCVHGAHGAVTL
jgi:hypothetical protein